MSLRMIDSQRGQSDSDKSPRVAPTFGGVAKKPRCSVERAHVYRSDTAHGSTNCRGSTWAVILSPISLVP